MIRPARITDRQALAQLGDRARSEPDVERHTLGLPRPRPAGARVPLSALMPSWMRLRQPSLHLVFDDAGQIVGSCRAVEEPHGGDWAIVELDAAPHPMAQEIRYELLAALVEGGRERNVGRYHAACSAGPENLEIFSQLDFRAYAEEEILYRESEQLHAGALNGDGAATAGATGERPALRPAEPSDAWHLFHLWSRTTPPLVARTEGYAARDWELADHDASVPRSSLTSLLRFGDVRAWLLPDGLGAAAFVQHAVSRDGPHYLRVLVDDHTDPATIIRGALAAAACGERSAGVLAPVRTYESRVGTAALDEGFEPIGTVSLLVRDVHARVRQPALVPVIQ